MTGKKFKMEIVAEGEDGERIETTVEIEGEMKEDVVESYREKIDEVVDYWDIRIERVGQID